jgi:hypothetical protein
MVSVYVAHLLSPGIVRVSLRLHDHVRLSSSLIPVRQVSWFTWHYAEGESFCPGVGLLLRIHIAWGERKCFRLAKTSISRHLVNQIASGPNHGHKECISTFWFLWERLDVHWEQLPWKIRVTEIWPEGCSQNSRWGQVHASVPTGDHWALEFPSKYNWEVLRQGPPYQERLLAAGPRHLQKQDAENLSWNSKV